MIQIENLIVQINILELTFYYNFLIWFSRIILRCYILNTSIFIFLHIFRIV